MKFGTAFADSLLQKVGPGEFVLFGDGHESLAAQLRPRGCTVTVLAGPPPATPGSVEPMRAQNGARTSTLVVCASAVETCGDPAALLRMLRAATHRYLVIAPSPDWDRPKPYGHYAWWAKAAFACGFRRAPSAYSAYEDCGLSQAPMRDMAVFERQPADAAGEQGAAVCVQCERLMDFGRQLGPKADAQAVLYAFAAEWIRPSDTVIVIDPAGGAGSALLAAQSRLKTLVSFDRCPRCTRYARSAYGGHPDLQMLHRDERLADRLPIADHLADVVIALADDLPGLGAETFTREVLRVLKPDGRLVVRAPHARLLDLRGGSLLLEAFYDVTGNGNAPAQISRRDQDDPLGADVLGHAPDGMAVFGRDPLVGPVDLAYRHPHFEPCAWPASHVTDFGRHYQNPWIYRALVQMGERIADEDELIALAVRTMNASGFTSPDTGAALTVIGYHLLSRGKFDHAADWLQVAGHYVAGEIDDVHGRRWQVSLRYCRALLLQAQGLRDAARQEFERVARTDVLAFSPLLATKVIAAAFWAGIMDLVDGRDAEAREWFQTGVRAARAALHADDANAIGNPQCPLDFGFQELAEVSDMASQCVAALRHIGLFGRSPGQFWRLVDVRRFGLASWARNLEQENQQLRQSLAEHAPAA